MLAKNQSPEAKQALAKAKQDKDEAEMASCTFRPATNWADAKKMCGEWTKSKSRFMEHVPERYVKARDDLKKKAAAADAVKPKEESSPAKAKTSPRSPGTPGSPDRNNFGERQLDVTRWPGSEAPRSPLNAYRGLPDGPGQHRGMATHVARVAAGRGIQELKQSMLLRQIDETKWVERRSSTTPVPFRFHTVVRRAQRDSIRTGPVREASDPVFEDLHRMLQSLQLSSQQNMYTRLGL